MVNHRDLFDLEIPVVRSAVDEGPLVGMAVISPFRPDCLDRQARAFAGLDDHIEAVLLVNPVFNPGVERGMLPVGDPVQKETHLLGRQRAGNRTPDGQYGPDDDRNERASDFLVIYPCSLRFLKRREPLSFGNTPPCEPVRILGRSEFPEDPNRDPLIGDLSHTMWSRILGADHSKNKSSFQITFMLLEFGTMLLLQYHIPNYALNFLRRYSSFW